MDTFRNEDGETMSTRGSVRVGSRVELDMLGVWATVRFSGRTLFAPGQWVGLELDTPCGKHDGTVEGERYFECASGRGIFVRPSTLGYSTVPDPFEPSLKDDLDVPLCLDTCSVCNKFGKFSQWENYNKCTRYGLSYTPLVLVYCNSDGCRDALQPPNAVNDRGSTEDRVRSIVRPRAGSSFSQEPVRKRVRFSV